MSGCLGNRDDSVPTENDASTPEEPDSEGELEPQTEDEECPDDEETEAGNRETDLPRIENLVLAVDEPTGYREYTPVQDAVYSPGSTVWIYFEPFGLATQSGGCGAARLRYSHSLVGTGPGGDIFLEDEEVVYREVSTDESKKQYVVRRFDLAETADPGTYSLDVTIVDSYTNEQDSRTITVTVASE
ncbi:hypothetical protein [Halalkaliarchaeum sp. AArc-CO]|uniref:hypothetical protein n=1 Tax=Halalkaliarchaeum sp. AArc-CO TaxID=2866381 RepID=UPI00217D468C|nr:hypothetical protein [Halalkaliarchaeum sp. AArc-CO]